MSIEEQIVAIQEATKKALSSSETARQFLIDAGIIHISPKLLNSYEISDRLPI